MENDSRLPVPTDGQRLHDANGRLPTVSAQAGARPGGGREEEIDWRRWRRVLWRHKWWIAAAVVLGTTPSFFVARNQETVYQAEAVVWINESPDQPWPMEVTAALTPTTLAEVIRSGPVLEGVVRELRLHISPERPSDRHLLASLQIVDSTASGHYQLNVGADGTYTLLDAEGNELQRVERGEAIGEPYGFRWTPPEAELPARREIGFLLTRPSYAATRIKYALEVLPGDDPRIFSVTYRTSDSGLAVDVMDALIVEFKRAADELKRQVQAGYVRALKQQLDRWGDTLRIAETRLRQFQVRTARQPDRPRDQVIIPAPTDAGTGQVTTGDPFYDRYYALDLERNSLLQDREALTQVLERLQTTGTLEVMRLEAIPSVLSASQLVDALDEHGRKEMERRTALEDYTPEHGSVRRLTRELTVLRTETIPTLVAKLVDRLDIRLAQLDREIAAQVAELERMPQRALEEARLEREFDNAEQIYNSLQRSYEEERVTEGATEANISVLDRSASSLTPVFYTPILVAFMLSLSLGLGGVILYDRFFERRIRYPDEVALDLGLHIVGVVPNLRVLGSAAVDNKERSLSVWTAVESFRGLRTQLVQGLGLQFPAVIAVTSPSPGDGKSLVAANLAISFAEPKRPTLIIDGDMRRGMLHRTFQVPSKPGLSEYLRGEAGLADILTMTGSNTLNVVTRGSLRSAAPELLDGDVFTELLEQLRKHFKVIIFDTPPLVGGVDGLLIGRHANAVVAVLRAGQTTVDLARAKLAHYTQALQVPVVAVLNDVPTDGPYGYANYTYTHYSSARE